MPNEVALVQVPFQEGGAVQVVESVPQRSYKPYVAHAPTPAVAAYRARGFSRFVYYVLEQSW